MSAATRRPILLLSAVLAVGVATGPAQAKDGVKAESPFVEAYEATYGIWTMICDPCMSYEDPVCTIWAKPESSGVWVFPIDEDDPNSPLAMSYLPTRPLNYTTEGTLTAVVDGKEVRVIHPPGVTYSELYGDLYIEPGPTASLVSAMETGTILTLEFVDAEGGDPEDFALDGFAAALADLQAHWPFPRRPYDYAEPDTCPY